MADEKKVETKKTAIHTFREKLKNHDQLKETILEGLKSTNSRVRSLASKIAFKLRDKEIIKKNVMPLIHSDKSKKVLRTISSKVTRKALAKRVLSMLAKKKTTGEKPAEAPAAAAAAPAPKA